MKTSLNPDLKRGVMVRVYSIYVMRKLTNPVGMRVSAFALLLVAFIAMVSVPNVVTNIAHSLQANGSLVGFFSSAFLHTIFWVKLVIVAEVLVVVMLVRDTLARLPHMRAVLRV